MIMKPSVSGRRSVVTAVGRGWFTAGASRARSGITLTELLIAIMILGVGLVSLATLFPIGLVRLRSAARWSRSATLLQSAACDLASRGLFGSQSFQYADQINYQVASLGYPMNGWYLTATSQYNPLIQDTPGPPPGDWPGGAYAGIGGLGVAPFTQTSPAINGYLATPGPGLPFAYDPLWRFQTVNPVLPNANGTGQPGGYYLFDQGTFEARFGYGLATVRSDPDPNAPGLPSAHGLQRLTNFNRPYVPNTAPQVPVMPASVFVPNIFVSPEDVVWQEASSNTGASPVVPDLVISGGTPSLDLRFTWAFTGQLTNAGNASTFDGNIVIFENRPFGIATPSFAPLNNGVPNYVVEGETVVEAIFGHGNMVSAAGAPFGYGAAADRTVLLRWPITIPDPVVRPGDWIADVTYERNQLMVNSRWWLGNTNANGQPTPLGVPNPANNAEWDNLPAQRCYWYQVQKVTPATTDVYVNQMPGFRSMVVYVNQSLLARTPLSATGTPFYLNAALIAPNVVNVIPQTIFIR